MKMKALRPFQHGVNISEDLNLQHHGCESLISREVNLIHLICTAALNYVAKSLRERHLPWHMTSSFKCQNRVFSTLFRKSLTSFGSFRHRSGDLNFSQFMTSS